MMRLFGMLLMGGRLRGKFPSKGDVVIRFKTMFQNKLAEKSISECVRLDTCLPRPYNVAYWEI